jgi:hypothetical protein
VQRLLMSDLLGLECRFLLICRDGPNGMLHKQTRTGFKRLQWSELLQSFNKVDLPNFMQAAIEHASHSKGKMKD